MRFWVFKYWTFQQFDTVHWSNMANHECGVRDHDHWSGLTLKGFEAAVSLEDDCCVFGLHGGRNQTAWFKKFSIKYKFFAHLLWNKNILSKLFEYN